MQKLKAKYEAAALVKDTLTMRQVQQDIRKLLMQSAGSGQCSNQQ